MSNYYYFKSRPGVIWVYVKNTRQWVRRVIGENTFEPDCITLRGMNIMGKINERH